MEPEWPSTIHNPFAGARREVLNAIAYVLMRPGYLTDREARVYGAYMLLLDAGFDEESTHEVERRRQVCSVLGWPDTDECKGWVSIDRKVLESYGYLKSYAVKHSPDPESPDYDPECREYYQDTFVATTGRHPHQYPLDDAPDPPEPDLCTFCGKRHELAKVRCVRAIRTRVLYRPDEYEFIDMLRCEETGREIVPAGVGYMRLADPAVSTIAKQETPARPTADKAHEGRAGADVLPVGRESVPSLLSAAGTSPAGLDAIFDRTIRSNGKVKYATRTYDTPADAPLTEWDNGAHEPVGYVGGSLSGSFCRRCGVRFSAAAPNGASP